MISHLSNTLRDTEQELQAINDMIAAIHCDSTESCAFENLTRRKRELVTIRYVCKYLFPVATGTIYFHWQSDVSSLGRKAARAMQSDSGVNWAYFVNANVEQVEAWLKINHWHRIRVNSAYDCTGHYYSGEPCITQQGRRILVKQSWGYDL